jgi:hypothetical protein
MSVPMRVCLVVLEMHTSAVARVAKHSVQKLSIMLNSNYSYTIFLYNILRGGNAVEIYVESI